VTSHPRVPGALFSNRKVDCQRSGGGETKHKKSFYSAGFFTVLHCSQWPFLTALPANFVMVHISFFLSIPLSVYAFMFFFFFLFSLFYFVLSLPPFFSFISVCLSVRPFSFFKEEKNHNEII